MGAWSVEPFGNDEAGDWAWELDGAKSWHFIGDALRYYLGVKEPDDSDDTIAVAAAEVVAHGLGRATQDDSYTESVTAYVERMGEPSADIVDLAQRALAKVSAEESELASLWDDEEQGPAWRDAVGAIADALGG